MPVIGSTLRLVVHPLVPEGVAWVLPLQQVAYLHPNTLERIKSLLWARQRTLETITQAELSAALAHMRGEAPP
jgi:hypothetical protein